MASDCSPGCVLVDLRYDDQWVRTTGAFESSYMVAGEGQLAVWSPGLKATARVGVLTVDVKSGNTNSIRQGLAAASPGGCCCKEAKDPGWIS